jgi:16S rRNA (guanine1207-N2)-methyltransferase
VRETDELFTRLRRFPDVEAPNLVAVDGADRLTLDIAGDALTAAGDGRVAIIDDAYGALTLGAAHRHGLHDLRVHQDLLTGERALARNAAEVGLADRYRSCDLSGELLSGAAVVLMRVPRALPALAEIADAIARHADAGVRVFAGGRDKHLSHAMNDVLGESFTSVRASLGRQKSRVLCAEGPRAVGDPAFPVRAEQPELGLVVVAHGAAFAGPRLDIGTRFLLDHLPAAAAGATEAVDLGCGTGILAVALAAARPELRVTATDNSAAAVASARATAAANGVADRVRVIRDDAMSQFPDAGADLIVCNPPFHLGAAVHTGAALKMFRAAGRVLRPGGQLWTVYNSHLNYRPVLERLVGHTDVVASNRKFRVARSTRRS